MLKKLFPVIACLLFISAGNAQSGELRIAVASNFYATLNLIKQQFEQQYDHRIAIIRGSTGKLFAQIIHGAPYDLFMAADSRRPLLLEQQGKAVPGTRWTYAIGQLALWSPGIKNVGPDLLTEQNFHKLAIANPKTAPYGQAAVEVMKALKLYEQVKPRLVYGENIAQAFQFVQSGSAELGFVALPHVKHLSSSYWLPPSDSYQAIEQQLVIIRSSNNRELAQQFVNFMQTDKIKQLIQNQGYKTAQ